VRVLGKIAVENLPIVLVVENEVMIRLELESALQDAGFQVTLASGSEEAMSLLDSANAFRALLTNINFGSQIDGWEVARHARETKPDLPVIYVTGANAAHWPSKGVPNSLLVAKPFASKQIVTAISQLMNIASTSKQL
jgi:CheY-like chemotaxis protein